MRKPGAEERLNKINRRVGELFDRVAQGGPVKGLEEGRLTRLQMRLPTETQPEALLIVKATSAQGDHIAFIGGLDIVQALLTWRAKVMGPGLPWREDIPWGERGG